jgi:hypothetical protein
MNTEFGQQLKAAFETASDFVAVPPGLADRVRAGARRRRRRALAATAAASAVLLAIAGTAYAATSQHRGATAVTQAGQRPQTLATVDYPVTQLAVGGRYLYVLGGLNSLLTAYDRGTGKLVRRVTLPSPASALVVGPAGLVWVSYSPDQGRGPAGIWLLTPDLGRHSADPGIVAPAIVAAGRTSAWVPGPGGLLRVHIPAPGQPGRASQQLEPGSSLGPGARVPSGFLSDQLGRRVAVLVTTGSVNDGHVVIAGSPALRYGGTPDTHIGAMTSTGNALWVTIYALRDGDQAIDGPLVRLNSALSPTTPAPVQSSPLLARTENVWSAGGTVWVTTDARGHSLTCFTAGDTTGPVTTLPVTGMVVALAASGSRVYVNALRPPYTYNTSSITSYPVPAACRA